MHNLFKGSSDLSSPLLQGQRVIKEGDGGRLLKKSRSYGQHWTACSQPQLLPVCLILPTSLPSAAGGDGEVMKSLVGLIGPQLQYSLRSHVCDGISLDSSGQ